MAIVSQDWLHRFTALRVDPDKGRGRAPHKPLLLLAVLDLLEAGQITDGWVTLSPDLVVRFQNCSSSAQGAPGLRHPFVSLRGQAATA